MEGGTMGGGPPEEPLPTVLVAPPPAPAAAPGAAPAPFGVGVLLGQTFNLWGRNLRLFLPLGLLGGLPSAVGTWILYRTRPDVVGGASQDELRQALIEGRSPLLVFWERMLATMLAYLPYTLAAMLLGLLVVAAVSHGALRRLAGERPGVGASLAAGLRAFPAVLGVTLLAWLVSVPATLALIFPALMLAVGWSATIPAIVAERLGPLAALRRSWALTRGHRWQLFAGFLLVYLTLAMGASVLSTPLIVLGVRAGMQGGHLGTAGLATPTAIVQLLQGALQSLLLVAPAAAYHGLRLAKEGQDPDQLRRIFE